MRTYEQAEKHSGIPATLLRAVVAKLGCARGEELRSTLRDVTEHGADAGFGSFCYYSDTCAFFTRHQKAIVKLAEAQAESMGTSTVEFVRGFRCLKDLNPTLDDVARVLFSKTVRDGDDNIDVQVANALAWFALEETARALTDE